VLARLEGRVSQIMKDLRYGSRLRRDEVVDLATFMAVMKFRVSSYRTFSAGHVAQNEARIRTAAFPSLEALRKDLRRHGHPEAEDPEAVERVFRDIHSGAYEMTVTKNHMLLHMFSHSQKIAKLLLQQNWTFAWALKGGSFATSDDPVLVMGPDLRAPSSYMGEVGFATPGARKVLPLSQDLCLIVDSGKHSISHGRVERETVRLINLEQAKHYERWLNARDEALVKRLIG
jgi:hypothetical protein